MQPFSFEYDCRRSRHRDRCIFSGPADLQRAAWQHHADLATDPPAAHQYRRRRAGTAAAGQGLADAALEHAQADALARLDLHETNVGRLRETVVLLQHDASRFKRRAIDVVDLDQRMRIAHRDRAETDDRATDCEHVGVARAIEAAKRDFFGVEFRHAHDYPEAIGKARHRMAADRAVE